jgi:hypothetical protein
MTNSGLSHQEFRMQSTLLTIIATTVLSTGALAAATHDLPPPVPPHSRGAASYDLPPPVPPHAPVAVTYDLPPPVPPHSPIAAAQDMPAPSRQFR